MLDVEILIGHHVGERSFSPKIKHKTTENASLPFILLRKPFPVKISLVIAMINYRDKLYIMLEFTSQDTILVMVNYMLPFQEVFSAFNKKILLKNDTLKVKM